MDTLAGRASKLTLEMLVGHGPVRCTVAGSDGAGQTLATCFDAARRLEAVPDDLGGRMLRVGYAFVAPPVTAEGDLPVEPRYVEMESLARTNRAGLWRDVFAGEL